MLVGAELRRMRKDHLRNLLKEKNLDADGTNKVLLERIKKSGSKWVITESSARRKKRKDT